jgi:UPF0716 protein FxsA
VLIAVLLFIILPIVEILVIVKVAGEIGGWNTLALLVATSIIGAFLVRHEGFIVLRRIQEQLNRGYMPGRELVDGALVLAGGIMMMVPGFITDALGLLLLFPPTRAVARGVLLRRFRNRVDVYVPGGTDRWRGRGRRGPNDPGGPGGPAAPGGIIDV